MTRTKHEAHNGGGALPPTEQRGPIRPIHLTNSRTSRPRPTTGPPTPIPCPSRPSQQVNATLQHRLTHAQAHNRNASPVHHKAYTANAEVMHPTHADTERRTKHAGNAKARRNQLQEQDGGGDGRKDQHAGAQEDECPTNCTASARIAHNPPMPRTR